MNILIILTPHDAQILRMGSNLVNTDRREREEELITPKAALFRLRVSENQPRLHLHQFKDRVLNGNDLRPQQRVSCVSELIS